MDPMASARRAVVERWWTTAIEIAKSKLCRGWGRERMSATATECGWCWEAMATRFVDLGALVLGKESKSQSVQFFLKIEQRDRKAFFFSFLIGAFWKS